MRKLACGLLGAAQSGRVLVGRVILGCGILTVALLGAAGCKSTGGVDAPRAYIAPDWGDQKIQTVAFIGLSGATTDENERKMAEDIVQQELRSSQSRFLVLPREAASDRAQKAGAKDDLKRVGDVWRSAHTVDQFLCSSLCQKLGVDGLLVATLDEWRKEKIDWQSEGSSFSEVGIELTIVGAKSGLVAWQASKRMREESPVYHPGQLATEFYTTDPNGTQRQGTASSAVPEAPEIDPLARKVMASLFAAFPEPPSSGAAPTP